MAKTESAPFTIYADQDPSLSGTPDGIYHNLLDEESIVACIEEDSSPLSTRRTSAITNITSVSSMPTSLPPDEMTAYTLHKPRTVFRSPSTFPTLQMASPTSIGTIGNSGSRRYTNQRRRAAAAAIDAEAHIYASPGTPTSARSQSVLSNHSQAGSHAHSLELEAMGSHSPGTPSTSQAQLPLVLLHVTLLSPSHPHYSKQLLDKVDAPDFIAENQRLLEEKLSDTVRTRGILIPHPGEEYDLLEERLLESLELCAPRLLGCGHFYGGERAKEEDFIDLETASAVSHDSGKGSSHCSSSSTERPDSENDMCPECSQPMHLPGKGRGSGSRRFDIKIYAANGLMRAGAWGAAWREMERVDVEIDVWMPETVRRELDQEMEREEEEHRNRVVQEESLLQRADAAIEALSKANVEVVAARDKAERARMNAEEQTVQLQKEMDKLTASSQSGLVSIAEPLPRKVLEPTESSSYVRSSDQDVSFAILLRKAFVIASRDPRNIAIATLSFLVLLLALTIGPPKEASGFTAGISSSQPPYCTHLPTSTVTNTIIMTNTDTSISTIASTPSLGQQGNTASTQKCLGYGPSGKGYISR